MKISPAVQKLSKNMPLKRVLKSEELYLVILKYQWVLLAIGIGVSLASSLLYPMHPDEKVFLKVAETMVQGGVPYRDVFDNKPPGIYLLLVPFVAIFGQNLSVLRLIPFLLNITIGCLLYFICRTILKSREGVVVAFLYLIISPFYQANFILTEVPMTVCLLIGTLLVWRYHKTKASRGWKEVFWAGFWVGLAILFKQTAFIYSLILPFFLFYSSKNNSVKKSLLLLGLYLFGVILPITLMIIYLISNNILAISYSQIIEYNLSSYPHSSIFDIILSFPQLLFPIVLLWVFTKFLRSNYKIKTYYFYFISSFIIGSIPLLLFRPYHHYWIPVLPYILLLV